MAGFSNVLRCVLALGAVSIALGLAPPPVAAQPEIPQAAPQSPKTEDGDMARDGGSDPDVIAPDKDGPSEDETDGEGGPGGSEPGGCQFNDRPLELLV